MSGNNENNYGWISTLRGFAALLVFTAHLPIPYPGQMGFIIGRAGVAIFFLIMGYLAVQARQKRTRKQYLFNRFV
ncbi:MAG: acyltransferase family protein, partial [Ruminococcus sp.]|uniref:acyltransferase family protein n=1 Tax=Ruminococcus sp. TaxID=41978 RepID=UPI0025ECDDD2